MKEFIVGKNDAGQRLDRFVSKVVPALPSSLTQKYIRLKRIKVNGKTAKRDYRLADGDRVQMYISDKFLETAKVKASSLEISEISPDLDIVYEDSNIIIINKPAGLLCYDTRNLDKNTLINKIQAYTAQNSEWQPHNENYFSPALCNRIDRNTSGIVITAKNAEALRIINEKIKIKEIDKFYLTVVHGTPKPESGLLSGYISKDGKRNLVKVTSTNTPDTKLAETEYKTLSVSDFIEHSPLSLLECKLITGRTHQIRAQLAHIGHPILGDTKYGVREKNSLFSETHQALCSYKIVFSFSTDAGILNYLKGKSFELSNIQFIEKYFAP